MIEQNKNKPASPLPDCSDFTSLANKFGSYFNDKIEKIREILNSKDCSGEQVKPSYTPPKLPKFSTVSEDEVRKIITSSPNKSCNLDPCPTSLIKECVDLLGRPIAAIINGSLSQGIFPEQFKQAHVTPLLKKASLPKQEFKNYRPVSNLNYISKLMEKVVASQIKGHVDGLGLDNPFQSAYKSYHSTETALLCVTNDILNSMGKGDVTALTLLDLSAAFDTIDHGLLLDRLGVWFGIEGDALKWVESYLSNRCQLISIQGKLSIPMSLIYGVPQGSVLGPLLFILYTTPLSQIILKYEDLQHHLYADDTQIYTSFNASNHNSKIQSLQDCLISVQDWMFTNKLKLNPDKTEFMHVVNKCQRNKIDSEFPVEILHNSIPPAAHAKNLGVYLDSDLNYQRHINNTVKVCNYYIRDIRRVRKHLNLDATTALANALVSSRLDYCNSLLHSVPKVYLNKLQRVQNSLARVVTRSSKLTSSKPLLDKLHWLPVVSRINFKIGTITYKAVHLQQPASLSKCLNLKDISYNTRTSDLLKLQHPSVGTNNYGRCAFSYTAPTVWNKIPLSIRQAPSIMSFRKQLKTYYFKTPPDV